MFVVNVVVDDVFSPSACIFVMICEKRYNFLKNKDRKKKNPKKKG